MDIKRFIGINEGQTGVSGLYAIYGSFGIVDGTELDAQKIIETQTGYVAEYDDFTVESVVENHENNFHHIVQSFYIALYHPINN